MRPFVILARPHLLSTGVRAVWVNGALVYNGAATGTLPGRVIRRVGR